MCAFDKLASAVEWVDEKSDCAQWCIGIEGEWQAKGQVATERRRVSFSISSTISSTISTTISTTISSTISTTISSTMFHADVPFFADDSERWPLRTERADDRRLCCKVGGGER